MNQHSQQEAKRDISSVNFTVTLTGLEIDTILTAVGVTTSMWAKNRRQMPGSFDLAPLSSGCDKLMNPVEEDYQQRCASHSDFQSERDISALKKAIIEVLDTGFESSERDLELVMDRIDAWEKGELRNKTSKWGDGNPRLQCRTPDGELRQSKREV